MKKQVVAGIVAMWALTGCGPADAVLHGYHRYTDPSVAMEPTIRQNSVFNARPVGPGKYVPKRGDVVVFTMSGWGDGNTGPFVKRVVAIGGDKIACCSGGKVTLNGAPLSEPYLKGGAPGSSFGPVTVSPGRIWLMGDNRDQSADSRWPGRGAVPASAVIGVAVLSAH